MSHFQQSQQSSSWFDYSSEQIFADKMFNCSSCKKQFPLNELSEVSTKLSCDCLICTSCFDTQITTFGTKLLEASEQLANYQEEQLNDVVFYYDKQNKSYFLAKVLYEDDFNGQSTFLIENVNSILQGWPMIPIPLLN
eukprot:TRINITY_DN47003_c0_g1_i1.p1 TRINITY_DN47003_c0_g1~~TRINITY_DN47003_c0_g1_i1.p1  ORF type:complete len:138 (+),score=5.54 TRINITY_DN47003_c0_g1_i1:1-414(+)